MRNAVGLFDQSSFAKYLLQGPDAERVLNRICANNVSVPVGKIVYAQWLNERGGIEADLTITREAADRFLIVTAAATHMRDFTWLQRHIPDDARAMAVDVSSGMAVLSVMGPRSRELLATLTDADLSTPLTELPKLVQLMLERGWTHERVRKTLGGNYLRALGGLRGES